MRSRSSRLFIVLLSLVGVSTNVPKKHGSHRGIVGVNPMAILLERLYLEDFDDGLDGLLRQAGAAAQDLLLEEPYWLQVSYECITRILTRLEMYRILKFCLCRMITTENALDRRVSQNAVTQHYGTFDDGLNGDAAC